MTLAPGFTVPASKVLAGWWRLLAPLNPRALWIGQLVLHRVEALVQVQKPLPLDPFALFVLKAICALRQATFVAICTQFDLERSFIRQILTALANEGLARQDANEVWTLTSTGMTAARDGVYSRREFQRKAFFFLESEEAGKAPEFLNLEHHAAIIDWPVKEASLFHPGILSECVRQPIEWKLRRGFPSEVLDVVNLASACSRGSPSLDAWRAVMIDQPKYLPALMVHVFDTREDESLVGFVIQQEPLALRLEQRAFSLKPPWEQVLPQVCVQESVDLWRQAWREWCHAHELRDRLAEEVHLERRDCRLIVLANSALIDRLRAARSEALDGDLWLTAGAGRVQRLARVQIAEAGRRETGRDVRKR